jgi:multiple sugar transport system substrate-binding protein
MKKYLVCLLVMVMALPLFAGGKQEAAKQVAMNVIVRNYTLNQDAPYKTAKAAMEQKFPNVTVNLEGLGYDDSRNKTLIAVGAGQPLDVVQLDYIWIGEYAEGKVLQRITDRVKSSDIYNDTIPQFLDSSQWGGEIFGVWLNTDVRIIGWVKEFVAAAGLDPDKAPATYEELVANAVRAQDPPETYGYFFPLISGEATVERWLSPLFSAGGKIVNDDFTKAAFNSAAGRKALQAYVDAVNKYKIIPRVAFESEEVNQLMMNKRLVYCFDMGVWEEVSSAGWTADRYKTEYGFGVPPKFEGGKIATTSGGYELGIPRTAVDPDLSWEFIKLVVAPENLKDWYIAQSRLGTRKSLAKFEEEFMEYNPEYDVRTKALQYTNFAPWNPDWVKMLDPLYTAIQKACLMEASVTQALNEAEQAVNKILSE